jgi:NADH dehydrogenase [ubiquinone] 1 alpha subcomplex assembly factor 7
VPPLETPLETLIRGMIETEGPIGLDRYMALCLGHPQHGYYMGRDPFGARGDFLTAPEVSQVFGELIGIWCIAAWAAMGQPARFNLVELGPGRGTLMADILRAAKKAVPAFVNAAAVHLVEMSPVLRKLQAKALGDNVQWHDHLEDVPEGPMVLVANEFFDAIPIRQFERRGGRWHERVIGLKDDRLVVGIIPSDIGEAGADGDVIEWAPIRTTIARTIGQRLAASPGAALIVDYGHTQTAAGDTLQAMKKHGYVSILETPGLSDITSHVDFEALAKAVGAGGAQVHPVLTQSNFLIAMGLEQRFAMLKAKADLRTRAILDRQMTRLAAPVQMGNLFKVLAATSPGLETPYPFAPR